MKMVHLEPKGKFGRCRKNKFGAKAVPPEFLLEISLSFLKGELVWASEHLLTDLN